MQAAIVIKTKNGYVVVPASEVPAFSPADMHVATELKSYSYSESNVVAILKELFEPPEPAPEVQAAPSTEAAL